MPDTTKHVVFTSFSSFFIAFHAQTIDFYKFFQFFMASMDIPMASMDSTLATNDLLKIIEQLEKLVKINGLGMNSNKKLKKTCKNHMFCCARLRKSGSMDIPWTRRWRPMIFWKSLKNWKKLVKNNGLGMKSNEKDGKTSKKHMFCCVRHWRSWEI